MTITPSRSGSIFGHSVKRTEDQGLITGAESYTGDLPIEGSLHVVFVRSPMAHGTLNSVDVEEARTKPGVVGVYVDGDLQIADRPGLPGVVPDAMSRPPLARGRVRFVGDIIAAVVAETSGQALDAAESVFPDIDPLPAVVGIEEAMAEGAPVIFEEHGSNVVAGAGTGEVEGIFDTADTVVSGKLLQPASRRRADGAERGRRRPRRARTAASPCGCRSRPRTVPATRSPATSASRPSRSA